MGGKSIKRNFKEVCICAAGVFGALFHNSLQVLFVLFVFNAGPVNLSMYVMEYNIGNSVVAGWAATVFLLAGMSISLVSPQCILQTSSLCSSSQELALAAALVLASGNIGTFLTPQITNIARLATGSEGTKYRFVYAIILALCMVVVTLVFTLREKKHRAEP